MGKQQKEKDLNKMISASEVAKIWNKRAQSAGFEGRYTRWSVYQRRDDLEGTETPLGNLYSQKKAEEINLRFGSPARPDTAERNHDRRGKKQLSELPETGTESH